jgi:hypothetical protein
MDFGGVRRCSKEERTIATSGDKGGRYSARQPAHRLKCWPVFFEKILIGEKRHDLRRCTDRMFNIGDVLELREFDPKSEQFTGRVQSVEVTYITSAELPCALSKEALHPNFCILSIRPL